jgi:hypothetical protein
LTALSKISNLASSSIHSTNNNQPSFELCTNPANHKKGPKKLKLHQLDQGFHTTTHNAS